MDLRPFVRGLGVLANGKHPPSRPGSRPLSALRTRLLSLRDAAALTRLAALDALGPAGRHKHRADRPAHDELRAAGISERGIDMVMRPILSGMFGEDTLSTSGRVMHLILRAFLRGGAAVPPTACARCPATRGRPARGVCRFGARVTSVAPGAVRLGSHGQVRARLIVVATDASTAAQLVPTLRPRPGTG